LYRDASTTAACCKIPKPEVEIKIKIGGGGHLENTLFSITQQNIVGFL